MNEKGTKRREWVKTVAIIFLSVLLVLTFFSNTIMNYSLPEVAAQYVESGTITAKIRGTGVIESGDPYNVEVDEIRKVQSVKVQVGDTVQKGDVLFVLSDEKSTELIEAEKNLETLQEAYEKAKKDIEKELLLGNISEDLYQYIKNESETSFTDFKSQLKNADAKVEEYTEKINQINASLENPGTPDTTAEDKALYQAEIVYSQKQEELTAAEAELALVKQEYAEAVKLVNSVHNGTVSTGDEDYQNGTLSYETALKRVEVLPAQIQGLENNVTALRDVVFNAKADVEKKQAAKDAKVNNTVVISNLQAELAKQQENLEAAVEAKNAIVEKINYAYGASYDLDTPYKAVLEAKELVDKLTEKSIGATIEAPIAGTVTSLNVLAGQTTTPGSAVAVLQPEGQGYTMSFSVTNEQSQRLSVGDRADLVNAWRYDDVDVILTSIKPDKSDPGKRKLLTFDVVGDVLAGQTLNVSVGQKSANYELIVPNSAIREDNNGKFILIVESKSSPLGNRYIATRVDIQVTASDDTKSAISGALYGYEFVITTSTKPVEAGQLIRLAEN